jgi:hypothetical protein
MRNATIMMGAEKSARQGDELEARERIMTYVTETESEGNEASKIKDFAFEEIIGGLEDK